MLIGIIVGGLVEEYSHYICKGVESMAQKYGAQVVIIPGKYIDMNYERDFMNKYGYCYNSLFSYGMLSCFDGLVIEMASVTMFATEESKRKFVKIFEDIPHVFVSYDKSNHSSVTIDNKAGLDEALEYMFKNGARKYCMLGGPENSVDAIERRECFETFIRRHELEYDPEISYSHGNFFLDCSKEANLIAQNNPDADVYVCANDILAKHMYGALKKYNKIPGKDVSVLGFDDSDFCVSTYPTISSVRTDIIELGKQSFNLLLETIENRTVRKAAVPSKFILRDSIVHREQSVGEIAEKKTVFQDFIKANVHIKDNDSLREMESNFDKILYLLESATADTLETLGHEVYATMDKMFLSESMKYLDWELFVNVFDKKFKEKIVEIDDPQTKIVSTSLYVEFLKKMMRFSQTANENRGRIDMDEMYRLEAFFRDTMQFARNSESNYAKFFDNVECMGIKNAYMYLFESPISYLQDEIFNIPDYLYLKAFKNEEVIQNVPQNSQKTAKLDIFNNMYINWKSYNRLTLFPIYAEGYIHGLIVCDMQQEGYVRAELFANQISSAVRTLQLRIENNNIVNEYEESVRKLKEYNITLDNMSKTDTLTGLNNRRGFNVRIENMLKILPTQNISLMVGYVDMNDLKIVNDRFGHDDGDFSLKTIGSVLTDFVTSYNGCAARIGGDEFAFAISFHAGEEPEKYRQEIYDAFSEFNKTSIKPYNVSVSVGYSMITCDRIIPIEDALNEADELLYSEKVYKKGNVLKGVKKMN